MQIVSDLMIYKPCGLMIYHNKLWMIYNGKPLIYVGIGV